MSEAAVPRLQLDPAYAAAEAQRRALKPANGAAAGPANVQAMAALVARLSKMKQAAIDHDPAVLAARVENDRAKAKLAAPLAEQAAQRRAERAEVAAYNQQLAAYHAATRPKHFERPHIRVPKPRRVR